MNQMQTNASTELAKDYFSKRKIPELFEVNLIHKIKIIFINISFRLNNWSYGS